MAVIMPHSAFIHVPKTGGTWCRQAIRQAKIPYIESGPRPLGHEDLVAQLMRSHASYDDALPTIAVRNWLKNDDTPADRFIFGFIRHPFKWLISRWADAIRKYGGVAAHDIAKDSWFAKTFSHEFPEFIDRVIEHCPTVVSEALLGRLGFAVNEAGIWVQGARPIDFIGKTENLVDDFIEALHRAGEKFNPAHVRSVTPKRVAGKLQRFKDVAQYNDAQREALYRANKQLFDDFGYSI